jgi:hypothetical protein
MPKFRKKPVVIEAVQFDGTDRSYYDVCEFAPDVQFATCEQGIKIQTLEGTMVASPGDWIIRGVKGELYPCKPDIFAATYDEVPA